MKLLALLFFTIIASSAANIKWQLQRATVTGASSTPGTIPDEFDARQKWPHCPTIGEIRDQGSCRAGWAFASVEAMSDRTCIHSNGKINFRYSAEDVLSCCGIACGSCEGGRPLPAWEYWISQGIVSGGLYNSHQGCKPYELAPCKHSDTSDICTTCAPCQGTNLTTPQCTKRCEEGYPVSYEHDKRYGLSAYKVPSNVEAIQREIMQNGPVVAYFYIYNDFLEHLQGVYHHVTGAPYAVHYLKIIGWGVEDGTPYWLIANSLNTYWGVDGYLKVLRGSNECGIESDITAGLPRIII